MFAYLTIDWDSYEAPDLTACFGLDGITQVDGQPTLEWQAKADRAWEWLETYGYAPVSWYRSGKRLPLAGYVRPVTIKFRKE